MLCQYRVKSKALSLQAGKMCEESKKSVLLANTVFREAEKAFDGLSSTFRTTDIRFHTKSIKLLFYLQKLLYFCNDMEEHLVISNNTEWIRIPAKNLVYASSDGNYSTLVFADGRSRIVTLQLGNIETMLRDIYGIKPCPFLRLGRGLIINLTYLSYINPAKGQLNLSDMALFNYDLTASRDALRSLKERMDNKYNQAENGRIR